jgi:hypothetical protein
MSANDASRIVINGSRMRLWHHFISGHDDYNMFIIQGTKLSITIISGISNCM